MPSPTTVEEYLDALPKDLAVIGRTLQAQFDEALPRADGQMWHGHPVWLAAKTPVAGFKAYPAYVTLLLWRGQDITDPSGRLEAAGSGKLCSVKLRSRSDLDLPLQADWLRQVRELGAA
ncbi:DUF1801 domain-containing protein [Cryobacterium algoritolerans]|uniref:DUF1801 domain-containing protein n=1 Tax=Cryobacterium algoritolerans TaxID=1259184 RepID=A0A4R8WIF2_9MICO|nr:DUF1801 domain-containing protein [Cryobacterium algoritolerans]TFC09909.1 DUF1801 domain-containing protein [Cryobacterium algoritolerans]